MEIQQRLTDLGYDVGEIDGLFGAQTQTAIKAFQRDLNLEQSGEADYELLELLRSRVN